MDGKVGRERKLKTDFRRGISGSGDRNQKREWEG
jgi:hypothetical protein